MAFIDILGFKEKLKSPLDDILNIMNEVLKTDNKSEYNQLLKIKTRLISDSFVIYSELTDEKSLTCFIVFVGVVVAKIHKYGNILTRGCIAYGNHYEDQQLWISPVFVDAYTWESKISIVPRIILHTSIIEKIKLISPSYLSTWFLTDIDGYIYLNYIQHINEAYKPNQNAIAANMSTNRSNSSTLFVSLEDHKNVIVNGIELYSKNPTIKSKYIWLANYHNNYVLKTGIINKSDLLISFNE